MNGQNIVDSDGGAGKVEEGGDYSDREYGQDYQGRLPNVSHKSLLEDLVLTIFSEFYRGHTNFFKPDSRRLSAEYECD